MGTMIVTSDGTISRARQEVGTNMEIVVQELKCPTCGAGEMHPDGEHLLIRGFKVDNWSQCLVCAGYYTKDLEVIDENMRPEGGWFR